MGAEIILKKIEQSEKLLTQLEQLLQLPFTQFENGSTTLRAAERNFQLIVEIASDMNTQLLLESAKQAPETYKQSFVDLAALGIIDKTLAAQLLKSARLRNILVHEYDFEEDERKFYDSAKIALPAHRNYLKILFKYVTAK